MELLNPQNLVLTTHSVVNALQETLIKTLKEKILLAYRFGFSELTLYKIDRSSFWLLESQCSSWMTIDEYCNNPSTWKDTELEQVFKNKKIRFSMDLEPYTSTLKIIFIFSIN